MSPRKREPVKTDEEKFAAQMPGMYDVVTIVDGNDEIVHEYESIDPEDAP